MSHRIPRPGNPGSRLARHVTSLSVVAPGLVLVLVWNPLLRQFHAPGGAASRVAVEAARRLPVDSVLREQREFTLLPITGRTTALDVSVAERLIQGRLELPDLSAARFSIAFSPDDFDGLPPALQLWYASFVVPDFLLAAYHESGREEFFGAARAFIVAWNDYERRAWIPRGALWNDHATAARVRVLAEFWWIYRARPDYDPALGEAVLEQAARYGHFLANPRHFTFSTNHGVMQNLGLLQLSLAFPTLPDAASYRQTALQRLARQMPFFFGPDGVIRENSAGYQAFGLDILAKTFRSMTLLGEPIPEPWSDRYAAGLRFLAALRRPDGTLPGNGDTDGGSLGAYPLVTVIDDSGRAGRLEPYVAGRPDRPTTLHAAAGYWVDWDGLEGSPAGAGSSQTVAVWTAPPAPGHKHADEMSVLLWSGGFSWLTSVGYWPYTDEARAEAEGWEGANAPHLSGEEFLSDRSTRLVAQGATGRLAAVDLERTGPGRFRARRQVVRVGKDGWIILDFVTADSSRPVRTVWTVGPGIEIRAMDREGSYQLTGRSGAASARIDFAGTEGTLFAQYAGSTSPFAGWHVVRSVPQPTPAVVVQQSGGEMFLGTVVSRWGASRPGAAAGNAPEHWTATLPAATGPVQVARTGQLLVVERAGASGEVADTLTLAAAPEVGPELAVVRAAFDSMSVEYPRFRPLFPHRKKASYLVVLLFLGQEAVFLLIRRKWPKANAPLRLAILVCWAGVAAWLHFDFLRSWEVVTPTMGLLPLVWRRTDTPLDHHT